METMNARGEVNEYGLTKYQMLCWISAIKLYGPIIMAKSLLSQDQKDVLISLANEENELYR